MGNQTSIPIIKEQTFNKFSQHILPSEIKEWSLTFRLMYPCGYMVTKDFVNFFSSLFPFGNVKSFSERLFNNINISQSGRLDINELLIAFTILFKGSMFEKLRWIFRFYDNDKDGVISKEELRQSLETINELITDSQMREIDSRKVADEIFDSVENQSGFLTFNDFELLAQKHPENFKRLAFFSS